MQNHYSDKSTKTGIIDDIPENFRKSMEHVRSKKSRQTAQNAKQPSDTSDMLFFMFVFMLFYMN